MSDPRLIPLHDRERNVIAYAIVDADDHADLSAHRWSFDRLHGYVYRRKSEDGRQRKIYMHRQLLGLERGDPREGDHRNGNGLDNRRSNLRIVTRLEQAQNHPGNGGTSEHRGVSWDETRGLWRAQATVGRVYHFVGRFETEAEAAAAAIAFRAENMPFAIEAAAA